MEINFAERMNHFKDGIFSVLNAKKRHKKVLKLASKKR